jgi:hypothetical protein
MIKLRSSFRGAHSATKNLHRRLRWHIRPELSGEKVWTAEAKKDHLLKLPSTRAPAQVPRVAIASRFPQNDFQNRRGWIFARISSGRQNLQAMLEDMPQCLEETRDGELAGTCLCSICFACDRCRHGVWHLRRHVHGLPDSLPKRSLGSAPDGRRRQLTQPRYK